MTWSLRSPSSGMRTMVMPRRIVAMVNGTADFPEPVLHIRYVMELSLKAPSLMAKTWKSRDV